MWVRSFIRNYVLTIVLSLVLLIFGIISYYRLGVDLMPEIDFPIVLVTTVYPGASATEVYQSVSKKMEDEFALIEGLDYVKAYSYPNISVIMVVFKMEVNADRAAQDVRDKVNKVLPDLPDGAETPVVEKYNPTAIPIVYLTLTSSADNPNMVEMRRIAEDVIKPEFQSVEGVGKVSVLGGKEREIWVKVDKKKVERLNISFLDITRTLGGSNADVPIGTLRHGAVKENLGGKANFRSLDDLRNTAIKVVNGGRVLLSDVAAVEDFYKERNSAAYLDSREAITIVISKKPGTNAVKVSRRVLEKLPEVQKKIPNAYSLQLLLDTTKFTREAISDLMSNLYLGAVLAAIVMLLFLSSLRSTLIISLAIPISLVATFTLLDFSRFTINFMTLMGMAVALGMVVDNAIVVLENVYRHLEEGEDRTTASINGTQEVLTAVTASTLSIVAVFLPIAYMHGIIGKFFKQFGLTVAFAIIVSLFVSLTLTPMLTAYTLKKEHLRFLGWWERFYEKLKRGYLVLLKASLRAPVLTLLIGVLAFLSTFPLLAVMKKEFEPKANMSFFYIHGEYPTTANWREVRKGVETLEKLLEKNPEVEHVNSVVGESQEAGGIGSGTMIQKENEFTIMVKMRENAKTPSYKLVEQLRDEVETLLPDADVDVYSLAEGGDFHDFLLVLKSNDDQAREYAARKVMEFISSLPYVRKVSSDFGKREETVNFYPKRDVMLRYGTVPGLALFQLRQMINGDTSVGYLREPDGKEVKIRVKMDVPPKFSADNVRDLKITTPLGNVPTSELFTLKREWERSEVLSEDREKTTRIYGFFTEEGSLGDFMRTVDNYLHSGVLPESVSYKWEGQAKLFTEMSSSMSFAFVLGVLLVYLVLAAQFNSFKQPLYIMLTVPLAIVGGVWALFLTHASLNIMSATAMVMLAGIVVKNAILLIDFINQKLREGAPLTEAVLKAGELRFRPVLMTAFTTIGGVVPTALGLGKGSEFKFPMAITIIGGMTVATLLTLVVIPAVYYLAERRRGR